MHPFRSLSALEEKEIIKGFFGKMVHTDQLTVAHFRIEMGSTLPEHHHVHEQVTNIVSGELEMTIGGETKVCKAGDVVVIPSGVPHSARALTDCRVIDVFQPARDDYR
jgi:quercetin dioxygenase-like cupin family protein